MVPGVDRRVYLRMQERYFGQFSAGQRQEAREILGHATRRVSGCGHVPDGLTRVVADREAPGRRIWRDPDAVGPGERAGAGVGGPRVVITGGVDDGDPMISETADLLQEEPFGLE